MQIINKFKMKYTFLAQLGAGRSYKLHEYQDQKNVCNFVFGNKVNPLVILLITNQAKRSTSQTLKKCENKGEKTI